MPTRNRPSPRSRRQGSGPRAVAVPALPEQVATAAATTLSSARAEGQAKPATPARARAGAARANGQGAQARATRPTRPPRPKPPGRAAVRRAKTGNGAAAPAPARPEPHRGGSQRSLAFGGVAAVGSGLHPLTDAAENARLYDYESSVKHAFDHLVPVLKRMASERCEPDFAERAQRIAESELGFRVPDHVLADAWITGLDMRRLFAACVFETYRRVSDRFFIDDPLQGAAGSPAARDYERFLVDCGFHLLDVTPCADGRLAHAISYVLRLPFGLVRRKSYAGALFDVENTVEKWVETELRRFREGLPSTADAPTRYLKVVMYHGSSVDPVHQGCAAHGSDDVAAAQAGFDRLKAFRQAVENSFCCGASVDLLLVGLDTDTDAIRVHVPDADGYCDLEHWLDAAKVYEITRGMAPEQARARIGELVRAHAPGNGGANLPDGTVRLIVDLIERNLSQIDYVRQYHGGAYADIGHAERFIGAGIGFEEIQLRNLTYFAYLATVEEGAADVDVGIKIFTGLNISHGLPVPIVVRYDYHGGVPGARERAIEHCERIAAALKARFPDLCAAGKLHCLRAVRDCDAAAPIEVVGSSLDPAAVGH